MAYVGEVIAIPLGEAGLTGSRALAKVPQDALLLANNISFDSGNIRKEGGAEKYNSTAIAAGPSIIGGHDWWPTSGVQRMIVYTSNGVLYKDSGDGSFPIGLSYGLSGAGVPVFAQGGQEAILNDRKLFVCDGVTLPRVLAGDANVANSIAFPAADWIPPKQPVTMALHDGRMWAGVDHRVYYSTVDDHENFVNAVNAGSLAIFPGVGDRIVQIMSYKGLLIVWKYPTGIFYVDTTSPIIANWGVRRLSEAVGGVSPLGACQVSDDVMFLDQAGDVQLLSGIQEYGTIGFKNLSQLSLLAPFIRDRVNLARLPFARAVFYPHKLEAHIALSQSGTGVNNARLVVDFNRPGAARFRWSPRDICESIWLRRDDDTIARPVIGDSTGFVWKLDQDTFRKGTEGYLAEFQTPHLDFRWADPKLATLRKNGAFLEIVCDPTGEWVMTCDVYWDNVLTQTIEFNVVPLGAVLGSFVLGTDTLGAPASFALRKRLQGSGKRLSLHFYNENVDEDFNISDAFVSFTLADERNI